MSGGSGTTNTATPRHPKDGARRSSAEFRLGRELDGDAREKMETLTKSNDIIAVARSAYNAYVTKERWTIEKLIAEDFHFTSPLDNRIDRATYFARCWPNSVRIDGFDFVRVAADGDRVFVIYEGR